jgi:hypothetical protein
MFRRVARQNLTRQLYADGLRPFLLYQLTDSELHLDVSDEQNQTFKTFSRFCDSFIRFHYMTKMLM